MSINGIGTDYPAARYAAEKTNTNAAGRKFAEQTAQVVQAAGEKTAVLHGLEEAGETAVFSCAEVVSGASVCVYKGADYDAQNPVYKVKIWDASGKATERIVDVSKVDPKNCDKAEMYAFAANLKESGQGSFEDTVLKAVVAKAVRDGEIRSGSGSFDEKTDWVKCVKDIMQSAYRYGDLKGYMEWKKFLGLLEK